MTNGVWGILGIEPTDSERDIKRAYARKLKVTRPDDDPAGFQELHRAFKTALMIAQDKAYVPPMPAAPPANRMEITYEDGQTLTFENAEEPPPPAPPEPPEDPLSDQQKSHIQELMDKVDALLGGTVVNAQLVDRWHFLTEPADLLDDEFRIELGRRVVGAIANFNQQTDKARRNRGYAPIGAHIITMLDDTFFWSSAPFLFTGPADFGEVMAVVQEVDPGLRQVTTKPVGGQIIEAKKSRKWRNADYSGAGYQFTWWQVALLAWFMIGLLKNCAY